MIGDYCPHCGLPCAAGCVCADLLDPSSPMRVITGEQLQDLWGLGFTITHRESPEKLFDLANSLAPAGIAYQWNASPTQAGWKCVPASRHRGVFAPYCQDGDIEIGGLWLMERPKADVDAFHADAHAKARANVDNWFERQQASGFIGGVTVLSEGRDRPNLTDTREVGDKTLESVTKIPRELQPYIGEVFAERDRLWTDAGNWWADDASPEHVKYTELARNHPDWTRGQLMNAVLTPIAIDNIRKRLEKGAGHAEETNGSTDTGGPIAGSTGDTPQPGPTEDGRKA